MSNLYDDQDVVSGTKWKPTDCEECGTHIKYKTEALRRDGRFWCPGCGAMVKFIGFKKTQGEDL